MRQFTFLILIALSLLAGQVHAMEDLVESNVDQALHAQKLDNALRSIEWFTLEYLRKAEEKEMSGNHKQADFFLEKADESDEKASKYRWRAIKAWYKQGQEKKAHEVSLRAAHIAQVRAEFVELRLHKSELELERLLSHGRERIHDHSVLDIYPSYEEAYSRYIFNSYELFIEWTEVAAMFEEADDAEKAEVFWVKAIDTLSYLFQLNRSSRLFEELPYQAYLYDLHRALMRLENLQIAMNKTDDLVQTRQKTQALDKLYRDLYPEELGIGAE